MDATLRSAVVGVAAAMAASMWAPWLMAGTATRNSFAVFRALQAVGLDHLTPIRVFWFLLPVLLGAVALAAVVGRLTGAGFGLGIVAAIVSIAAWAAVTGGSSAWGAQATLISGLAGIGVSSLILVRRVAMRVSGN